MNNYKPIDSLFKNLYCENSPILIEAGVLFFNSDNGKYHIQLKLKNLTNLNIIMAKVEFVLRDAIGREIGRQQKQYLDLKALPNQSFGSKDPCFLTEKAARKFDVLVNEVCFEDGSIWTPNEGSKFEHIPFFMPLSKVFSAKAVEEFKFVYCKNASFVPFKHDDLWVCACGNVNKNSHENCCSCGANFLAMSSADGNSLSNDNVYREASYWATKTTSADIKKAIDLFASIADWKDSQEKIEKLQEAFILAEERERVAQEEREREIKAKEQEKIEKRKARKKKAVKLSILSLLTVIVLAGAIIGCPMLIKINRYNKAVEYIENHEYEEALELFEKLGNYKDSKDKARLAKYILDGDYIKAIEKFNLTEIYIPYGVTEIEDEAFLKCNSLKKVVIADSVTSIGNYAFGQCYDLTEIIIPTSVTSIGIYAFSYCSNLTHIKYKGSQEQWAAITKKNSWNYYAGDYTITYNYQG